MINNEIVGTGKGKSKKGAQQAAANMALDTLRSSQRPLI
jgi:dsRNA-specific ribonuclease